MLQCRRNLKYLMAIFTIIFQPAYLFITPALPLFIDVNSIFDGYVSAGDNVSSTIVLDIGIKFEAGNSPFFSRCTSTVSSSKDKDTGDEYLLISMSCSVVSVLR